MTARWRHDVTGKRILFGGLFHETHTFVDEVTTIDSIKLEEGAALLRRRGDGSTTDGFLEVAEREGWTPVPTALMRATPSGRIEQSAFETFWRAFSAIAEKEAAAGLDGLWFDLHGAMVTTEDDDPEGTFLARVRALPGAADLPLFGVFDLHATFTEQMARHADGLVGYRENPHTDARAMAVLSAELLARSLREGRRPRIVHRATPIVWPPTGTGTADVPMKALEQAARAIEAADPAVWAANIVAGYAFADTRDTGVSMNLVTTGAEGAAGGHLDRVAALAMEHRARGIPEEWDLVAAIADALTRPADRPIIFVEPADNIGGGAPGDCTSVLRAFLQHALPKSGVIINDPQAVATLADRAIGSTTRIAVGGKGGELDPGPVPVDATLISRSDGRFTLEDRQSHLAAGGVHIEMGPCAVVQAVETTILLTSRKTPPFDLGQWRSQGVAPETLRFIGVKAAVAHRRAYDKIAARSYLVAVRGACPSDLTTLPYKKIRRPIFPLDA
ncbi:MAG: microcystin degradation protein MlrC [Rhizobiales bacterium 65-9]|nr:MAG: microcystin degradation protein MlrC [Rhizobiales bacterium 65-9]